jgi:hypothetical protein
MALTETPIACTLPQAETADRTAQPDCSCAPSRLQPGAGPQLDAGTDALPGTKAAGLTALTMSAGAVACAACCVLPFAVPAALLGGSAPLIAWIGHNHIWVVRAAILAFVGAWAWIAWQAVRTQKKPASSTLAVMAISSVLMTIALAWPFIEKPLLRALKS